MNDEPPFPWIKDKPDTFRHHLENDTGAFEAYTRNKRLQLGASLLKQRRIYLDTKYWVYIRDVYLNRPQKPIHCEIFTEIRRLRIAETTVCPISFSVLNELMYQSDEKTRAATAKMIDEFSGDATIQPLFEVFKTELCHFIAKSTKPDGLFYDLKQLVWTKTAFVLGDLFLSLRDSGLPHREAVAMQKNMDDALWATKFSELIQTLSPEEWTYRLTARNLAQTLSDGKFQHQKSSDTFEKLFLDEVTGVMDVFSDICGDYAVHFARQKGMVTEVTDNQKLVAGKCLGYGLRIAFEKKMITTEFPTISVPASLHAAVRLDPKRKYKPGDFEDFHHSALAVGYFDAFLTESSLQHLLTSKLIDVKKQFGCTVLSDEQEVLAYLRGLN